MFSFPARKVEIKKGRQDGEDVGNECCREKTVPSGLFARPCLRLGDADGFVRKCLLAEEMCVWTQAGGELKRRCRRQVHRQDNADAMQISNKDVIFVFVVVERSIC